MKFSITNSAVRGYKEKVKTDPIRMTSDNRVRAIIVNSCRASETCSRLEQLGVGESLEGVVEFTDSRIPQSFGRYKLRVIKEKRVTPKGVYKGLHFAITKVYPV